MFARRSQLLFAAAVASVLGLSGVATAGDIFCPHPHKDSGGNRGTRGTSRDGTVYMPTQGGSQQMMGICAMIPCGGNNRDTGLERALEAEHHMILAESNRAAFEAEVKGKQRLLQRLGSLGSNNTTDAKISEELNSRLKSMEESLKALSSRMTDVERLLLVHDNYLQELYKNNPPKPVVVEPKKDPMPK